MRADGVFGVRGTGCGFTIDCGFEVVRGVGLRCGAGAEVMVCMFEVTRVSGVEAGRGTSLGDVNTGSGFFDLGGEISTKEGKLLDSKGLCWGGGEDSAGLGLGDAFLGLEIFICENVEVENCGTGFPLTLTGEIEVT